MAYLRGLDKGEKCQKQTNTSEAQLRNDMLYGGGGEGVTFPLLILFFFPPNLSNYGIPFLAQPNAWMHCPDCAAQIHCQDTNFSFLGHRLSDPILHCGITLLVSGAGPSGEHKGILQISQEGLQPRRDFPNSLLRRQCQHNVLGLENCELLIYFYF